MRRSYKFRLYPNKTQAESLERSLDLCRDLYNAAVQERRDAWRMNRVSISFFDQSKQVAAIRELNPDYLQIQSRVCNQVLRQVDKSFKAFFRRVKAGGKVGFPRFKGKSFFNSFVYNREGFRFFGNKLRLANVGLLKMKLHRPIEGTVKEIIVKREGLQWYAVVSCDAVPENPLPATDKSIGIDVGIKSFATLSDGKQIENGRLYELAHKKLRVAQRQMSRRAKGSNRRRKAVARLQAIHQNIFNQRHDFQHKLSHWLIKNYDLIAVEKLNICGMSKGFLSKQILDASWGSLFHKLAYKAESAGRQLIAVDPRNTSQTCTCGETVKKKLSVRWHHCFSCGLSVHRDVVSAQVILSRGLRDQNLTLPVAACVF